MNAVRAKRRRRRGTALVELALCIPILASVIVLSAFFGWAMTNQQHVKAASRYAAWRRVKGGWHHWNWGDPHDADDPCHPGLNEKFFRDEASSVHVDGWSGPVEEFEDFISSAGEYSDDAAVFADQLMMNPPPDYGTFQHARQAKISAKFHSDLAAFEKYHGAIRSHHIRDGVEWRRNDATIRHVTRIQYLDELDEVLYSVESPGEGMAKMIQNLYRNGW